MKGIQMRSARRLVAGLTVALMATTLASCGGNASSSEDGEVTINFFHRWPNEPKKTYFADLVAEFEEANPGINVEVESVLNDAYKDKVKVVAGSSNAPDVMFTWSGTFVNELVEGGNVMALDEWLADNPEIAERYYPSQMKPLQVDGKQYALPIGMHSKVFFYNADVFAEHGLEAPKTWEEFIDVLETLQAAGLTPIEFGGQEQWPIAHYVGTLNQRVVDPAVFDADRVIGSAELTDPGYVTALERFEELTQYMNEDLPGVTHEIARNAWVAGEAPIMYMQSAEVGYFEDADFEYSTFNFPAVEGGKGSPEQLTGAPEGFLVSANTEHPEESLKFLEFMLNKENGIAYTEQTGELSAVVGAVEESDSPQIIKTLAQQIVDADAMTPWLDNAYEPQIVATYLSEAQSMLVGQNTPAGVMEAVAQTAAQARS